MTYHEFINRPRALRIKIEHKIEDVRLKESACMTSTSPLNERVQTSTKNTAEASYVRYIDAKNCLVKLMDEYDDAQNEVRDFLYRNLPLDEADLLEWRYIDSKSIKESIIAFFC